MANATVVKAPVVPVTPAVEKVTLELSPKEARALLHLLANVSVQQATASRLVAAKTYKATNDLTTSNTDAVYFALNKHREALGAGRKQDWLTEYSKYDTYGTLYSSKTPYYNKY